MSSEPEPEPQKYAPKPVTPSQQKQRLRYLHKKQTKKGKDLNPDETAELALLRKDYPAVGGGPKSMEGLTAKMEALQVEMEALKADNAAKEARALVAADVEKNLNKIIVSLKKGSPRPAPAAEPEPQGGQDQNLPFDVELTEEECSIFGGTELYFFLRADDGTDTGETKMFKVPLDADYGAAINHKMAIDAVHHVVQAKKAGAALDKMKKELETAQKVGIAHEDRWCKQYCEERLWTVAECEAFMIMEADEDEYETAMGKQQEEMERAMVEEAYDAPKLFPSIIDGSHDDVGVLSLYIEEAYAEQGHKEACDREFRSV